MRQTKHTRHQRISVSGAGICALTIIAAGCITRPVDEAPNVCTSQRPLYLPQSIDKEVDILFVVDNSASMSEEQASLRKNFPRLIDALRSVNLGPDASGKPCAGDNTSGCKIPNVRIGVVTSDLGAGNYGIRSCGPSGGDRGRLQARPRIPGCQPPIDRWIEYRDGKTNIPGANDAIEAVKSAFSCIASVGVAGCGFEQTLESARRALEPGVNPGFLRDDALLAIVFITDEDDCSVKSNTLFDPRAVPQLGPLTSFRCFEHGVHCDINDRKQLGPRRDCKPSGDRLHDLKARYIDYFRKLKPPGRVMIAAITGPSDRVEVGRDGMNPTLKPSCQSSLGAAAPAIRLGAVIEAFGSDGQLTDICGGDFAPAMTTLGEKIVSKLSSQCFPAPLLTPSNQLACMIGDRGAPGHACPKNTLHEASCDVTEQQLTGTASERSTPLRRCPKALWYPADWRRDRDCQGSCPCWRLVRKPNRCRPNSSGSPYALDILRSAAPQKGTVATMRCLTAVSRWQDTLLDQEARCR